MLLIRFRLLRPMFRFFFNLAIKTNFFFGTFRKINILGMDLVLTARHWWAWKEFMVLCGQILHLLLLGSNDVPPWGNFVVSLGKMLSQSEDIGGNFSLCIIQYLILFDFIKIFNYSQYILSLKCFNNCSGFQLLWA